MASVSIAGTPAAGLILVGAPLQLTSQARDAAGALLTRPAIWFSSAPNVATVSASGLVSPLQAGEASIQVGVEGVVATTALSVRIGIAVPPANGSLPLTTSVLDGAVTVTVPPGATTASTLYLRPVSTALANSRSLAGTTFEFGPPGTTFSAPVTLSVRYDTIGRSADARRKLRLYRVNSSALTVVPGSSIDTASRRVIGQVTGFSTFTVGEPATATSITAVAGGGQAGALGAELPVRPRFVVRDADGVPVPFERVIWGQSTDGRIGGTATAIESDELGVVTLGAWSLGNYPGVQTLSAYVAGTQPSPQLPPATITAIAVSPLGVNLFVSRFLRLYAYGVGSSTPILVDLSNRGTLDVGMMSVEVTFDTTYQSFLLVAFDAVSPWTDDNGARGVVTVDSSQAGAGRIVITGTGAALTTLSFSLGTILFDFRTSAPFETTIRARILEARNAAGSPITVTPRDLTLFGNPP